MSSSKTAATKKTIECLLCRAVFAIGEGKEATYATQSLLCLNCRNVLRKKYHVPFANRNGGYTRFASYLSLIRAVRLQAEADRKLDDFESYWIDSAKWNALWDLLKCEINKHDELCAVVRQFDV